MSIIAEIIDTLENKFKTFSENETFFRTNNQDLKEEIIKLRSLLRAQSDEIGKETNTV
jgi:hypothetical protein